MKLYVFDSCPYCTLVRAYMHLAQLSFELVYVSPGEFPQHLPEVMKTVPILESDDGFINDSLNIIRQLESHRSKPLLTAALAPSPALLTWLQQHKSSLDKLCYPRMLESNLPELAPAAAQNYFRQSRAKAMGLSLEQALHNSQSYMKELAQPLETLMEQLQLPALLQNERAVQLNDLYAFAHLRNLTMVTELNWPAPLGEFLRSFSRQTQVPLY